MIPPRGSARPAKMHVEYGARERLGYYNKRDRSILKRMNREPVLVRFLNWLLSLSGR